MLVLFELQLMKASYSRHRPSYVFLESINFSEITVTIGGATLGFYDENVRICIARYRD